VKTIKWFFLFWLFLTIALQVAGQPLRLKVWPSGPPSGNGITTPEETLEGGRIANVSEAEIFTYLPDKEKRSGLAVVICPGGGYRYLAMQHEGHELARWLADRGIAGVVLKYRMPNGHPAVPGDDARRALRIVRSEAAQWGIDPSKVGIAGSSAGGHLAATVSTRFDGGNTSSADPVESFSSRPDFTLLLYPVISMKEELTHLGSRKNLLGEGLHPDLAALYSNEMQVDKQTPPAFIVLADNDKTVAPGNSVLYYDALKSCGIPAEMHLFALGGHGFGMRKNNLPADQWPELFVGWLKASGLLEK